MEKLNGFIIQEKIRQQKRISHPMIQAEFCLDYNEAKEFISELIYLGWVEKEEGGRYYRVMPDNMKLRRIERSEIDSLFDGVDFECVNIMRRLQEAGRLTDEQLYTSPIRRIKGKGILTKLLKLRLISEARDGYILCISAAAVDVLAEVVASKEMELEGDGAELDEFAVANIKKKFEALFDGE